MKAFLRIVYHQIKNLFEIFRGGSLTYYSLGSTMLDKDDVRIARRWLYSKKNWNNTKIVTKYEKEFTDWNGSKYAFAFMGGRVALSACIYALNMQHGDEVILPGYTCVVVPNAFHFAGVKTVYSDIELDTYGLDASFIEDKITSKTKAIMLHHLYGLVCRDYEKIIKIAKFHNLKVIEDCTQSTGAEYNGRKIGNLGDVSFYSNEQSKVFTTIQGGLAVTNNDLLAVRLREYYDQASYPDAELVDKQLHSVIINYYSCKDSQRWWKGDLIRLLYRDKIIISTTKEEEAGIEPIYYGRKMSAPIAAIGLNQLKKIDIYNQKRRETAKKWDKWCNDYGYKKPVIVPNSIPVYLRYPVMVEPKKKRDTFWAKKELGINLGVWFVSNIHPTSWQIDGCPNANSAVKQCVNFPTILH